MCQLGPKFLPARLLWLEYAHYHSFSIGGGGGGGGWVEKVQGKLLCFWVSASQCVKQSQWLNTSHHKRKHHFCVLLHSASPYIALITMATSALSLGSAWIQSEWDCKDSSGLHLFIIPHQNSVHPKNAGTKTRDTPEHQPGMTSKIWDIWSSSWE